MFSCGPALNVPLRFAAVRVPVTVALPDAKRLLALSVPTVTVPVEVNVVRPDNVVIAGCDALVTVCADVAVPVTLPLIVVALKIPAVSVPVIVAPPDTAKLVALNVPVLIVPDVFNEVTPARVVMLGCDAVLIVPT